jgi:DNA topoisomerase I
MTNVEHNSQLEFSTDTQAGISRKAVGGTFVYRHASGRPIRSRPVLARIAALVIPPAWTDVWISTNPNGHLQATGRDIRGRKQYRYHARWVADQDTSKFEALYEFGCRLPAIRRRVRRDLKQRNLDKQLVLAAVVQLIDHTFIRIGGERYRRDNGSFGATTLRNRHVKDHGGEIYLDFNGKSGKHHRVEIKDGRVAKVIRACLHVPGQLFSWKEGQDTKSVTAADVNEYLQQAGGSEITSKDFRTWGGTVVAAATLEKLGQPLNSREATQQIRAAVLVASRILGNTPAVCRRSYIHPAVLARKDRSRPTQPVRLAGLRRGEQAALGILAAAQK